MTSHDPRSTTRRPWRSIPDTSRRGSRSPGRTACSPTAVKSRGRSRAPGRAKRRTRPSHSIRARAASHDRLGQFYFEAGDREAACKQFQDGPGTRSGELAGQRTANWGHSTPIDLEYEIKHTRRDLEQDPLSAVGHQILGVFLFAAGRLEDAKSEFINAQELNPDGQELPLEIVRVLVAQRRYDEAWSAIAQLPRADCAIMASHCCILRPGGAPKRTRLLRA